MTKQERIDHLMTHYKLRDDAIFALKMVHHHRGNLYQAKRQGCQVKTIEKHTRLLHEAKIKSDRIEALLDAHIEKEHNHGSRKTRLKFQ